MVRFYNKCDIVFAPTLEMKEQLERKGAKRVELWSRGIRKDMFSPKKRSEEIRESWNAVDRTVVLFSGRFVKYKDLDVVKGIYLKTRKDKRDDMVFVLMGKGPMENELRKEMPDAVFPGYLEGEELSRSYASGDIFLFPSTTETFGNVVQEAIASGLPAIVSDIGGCKEIVESSESGFVCRAKDVKEFYLSIIRLIDDRKLYGSLRNKGLEWSKSRTWESINGSLIRMFEDLVDQYDGR